MEASRLQQVKKLTPKEMLFLSLVLLDFLEFGKILVVWVGCPYAELGDFFKDNSLKVVYVYILLLLDYQFAPRRKESVKY